MSRGISRICFSHVAFILSLVLMAYPLSAANASAQTFTETSNFSSDCGVHAFSEGLAQASSCGGNNVGFIDSTGNFVIPAAYSQAGDFSEGLASVSINGLWGFINTSGKWAVQPKFNGVKDFHDNLALVVTSINTVGFIDQDGKIQMQIGYEGHNWATDFSENLTSFPIDVAAKKSRPNVIKLLKPGVFINKVIKNIILGPGACLNASSATPAAISMTIGSDGKIKIYGKYTYVGAFNGGLAFANLSTCGGKILWSGFIDPAGNRKITVAGKFQSDGFVNGIAVLDDVSGNSTVSCTDKFGLMSPQGKWIIKPSFTYLSDFSGGLALASVTRGACGGPAATGLNGNQLSGAGFNLGFGIIDQSGNPKTSLTLNLLGPFLGIIAPVEISSSELSCGFVDEQGNAIGPIGSSGCRVLSNELVSLVDANQTPHYYLITTS